MRSSHESEVEIHISNHDINISGPRHKQTLHKRLLYSSVVNRHTGPTEDVSEANTCLGWNFSSQDSLQSHCYKFFAFHISKFCTQRIDA